MRRHGREFEERYPDYFCWLCEMVAVDGRYTDAAYWVLAKVLWNTDFYYSMERDEDRLKDGLALRDRYYRVGGTDSYDGPCTVLEVLVALADRMDCIMDELDGECRITMFFWEMIDNLGLSNYSDDVFESYPKRVGSFYNRIDVRIDNWLSRNIDYNGQGGLFPLERPRSDQRETDIWYQANAYLLEQYM